MRYGQKGGDGPTAGKKATTYLVKLPDGLIAKKRVFDRPENPAGYVYQCCGIWYVATVDEADNPRFKHYTQAPAEQVTR